MGVEAFKVFSLKKIRENWLRSSNTERSYYFQLGLVGATQLVDLSLTHIAITGMGGTVGEGSPIAGLFLQDMGTPGLTLLKLGGAALILRYAEKIRQKSNPGTACKMIAPVNFGYTCVAALNTWTIYQSQLLFG